MKIETVETPELGNRSYVVSDGTSAVVIDPQRDLDRFELVLDDLGVPVAHVLETHVHNDYVTGGFELARRTGAAYGINAGDPVEFERNPLHDGDELTAGDLRIRVLATPGHTPTHLSYLVEAGLERVVFTGGSLLFGTVGRTDLIDPSRTRALAAQQWRSAQRLAALAPDTGVLPTHGFGSFCAGGATSDATASTIGQETQKNSVFLATSETAFVEELVASFGAYPTYYASMAPVNSAGPAVVDLAAHVPQLSADDVARRIGAGETVIDVRERAGFAAGHRRGVLSVPLTQQFATYVGWLVPFGSRLTLLADSPDDIAAARRQLTRIGYDDVAAGPIEIHAPAHSYRLADYATLADERRADDVVLDVRRTDERADGTIAGSVHVPLHELTDRLDALPHRRVWVHCASGYRAGIAASILDDAGFDVIHLDDTLDNADTLGLTTS